MNRNILALAAVAALNFGFASVASAEDSAMTAPINAPKETGKPSGSEAVPTIELKPQAGAAAESRDEFKAESKTAPGAPKPGAVSMDDLAIPSPLGDMALGPADAPVTVVEYASMTCSHCATFGKENFARLKSEFVDAGKVRYVFREFPLDIKAFAASILTRCIAKADAARFFDLTDRLFRTQDDWMGNDTAEKFKILARKEGLEQVAFEACFNDADAGAAVKRTQQVAVEKLGVNSTPTFFVNGVMVKGNAWPLLEKAIKDAIADRS